jgi:hypothetical protein
MQSSNDKRNSELERRIELLESGKYELVPKFTATDYIITAIVVLICLALVVGGAFL